MWSSTKNEIIKKSAFQTVFVLLSYTNGATDAGYLQTFGIYNLKFKPDEMLVKNIITYSGASTGVYVIKSDLVDWYILGSFTDGLDTSINIYAPFQINKEVNGTYTFTIYQIDGQTPANITVQVAIQLEFIKY